MTLIISKLRHMKENFKLSRESKTRAGKTDARAGILKKLSFSMVLYQLWRGFYFLDAFLCSSFIRRVHCEIRVTPFLFVRYTVTICEK